MTRLPNYLMCFLDDGFKIIGPFATPDAMLVYSFSLLNDHGLDCPSLYLANPHVMPTVIDPGAVG